MFYLTVGVPVQWMPRRAIRCTDTAQLQSAMIERNDVIEANPGPPWTVTELLRRPYLASNSKQLEAADAGSQEDPTSI